MEILGSAPLSPSANPPLPTLLRMCEYTDDGHTHYVLDREKMIVCTSGVPPPRPMHFGCIFTTLGVRNPPPPPLWVFCLARTPNSVCASIKYRVLSFALCFFLFLFKNNNIGRRLPDHKILKTPNGISLSNHHFHQQQVQVFIPSAFMASPNSTDDKRPLALTA